MERKQCIDLSSWSQDFDKLLEAMKSALAEDSRSAFVFNCSNGKGRTTTAMVVAVLSLWHFNVRCTFDFFLPGIPTNCHNA